MSSATTCSAVSGAGYETIHTAHTATPDPSTQATTTLVCCTNRPDRVSYLTALCGMDGTTQPPGPERRRTGSPQTGKSVLSWYATGRSGQRQTPIPAANANTATTMPHSRALCSLESVEEQPGTVLCSFGGRPAQTSQSTGTRSPAARPASASSTAAIVSLSEKMLSVPISESCSSRAMITATGRPWTVMTVAVPVDSASSTISSRRSQASVNDVVRALRSVVALWSYPYGAESRTNRQ